MATSALGQAVGRAVRSGSDSSAAIPKLDTTLSIETPERVIFSHQLAGPALRTAAYLLDLLVRFAFILVVMMGLSIGVLATGRLRGLEAGVVLVLFFTLEWGYFVVFDVLMHGSSPGKRVLGLRVIHESGRPLTGAESILRNLLRAADILPFFYAIGLLTMCFDRNFRRLGDLVAGTVVVRQPRVRMRRRRTEITYQDVPGLPQRPLLTRDELSALALFERRSADLGRSRALELAQLVAPKLRARFGVQGGDAVSLLLTLAKRGGRS